MTGRITPDYLYQLLPSIYRIRDAEQGYPLRDLVGLLADQFAGMERDIFQLYENAFIETCQEWAVPYLGDLTGQPPLHGGIEGVYSRRAFIANTLRYRRRKGTAAMLEQMARDITGLPTRAVEYFRLTAENQFINHHQPEKHGCPDIRDGNRMELIDSPFDHARHTVDVRSITSKRGRHHLPHIGLHQWQLQAMEWTRMRCGPVNGHGPGCFTFHPLGFDEPLYNNPQTETEITHLAEERNLPVPLRRRLLHAKEHRTDYFDSVSPVLQLYPNNALEPIPPAELLICNLSTWQSPPNQVTQRASDGTLKKLPIQAAIDPVLGRITLPAGSNINSLTASYQSGSPGPLGGGSYQRIEAVETLLNAAPDWLIGVSKRLQPSAGEQIVDTLGEALTEWRSQPSGTRGLIVFLDSDTYSESAFIEIPDGSELTILSGVAPEIEDPSDPSQFFGLLSEWSPERHRATIDGDVTVVGLASDDSLTPGTLQLHGLLISSNLVVNKGQLGSLRIDHCTFLPESSRISIADGGNDRLQWSANRSILSNLTFPATIADICITDSLIGGDDSRSSIEAPLNDLDLRQVTTFSRVNARTLNASNSIFLRTLTVERRQEGCIRYSYFPADSLTPRAYRCQPKLEIQIEEEWNGTPLSGPEERRIQQRTAPIFESDEWLADGAVHPAYGLLSTFTARGIQEGADDGNAMGAWHFLHLTHRLSDLRTVLPEYLRAGLLAGTFLHT